jgi:hypothetical protein
MVRDVEANAPWQRLRRNLLMVLQLIFLAILIFVLAQPFLWTEGVSGQAAIIIIDHSASMGATDSAPNRLEAAKNQARQLADGLPDDARVTIIAAAENAQVLASATLDKRQVHQAIERIQLSSASGDLATALGLASAIASRQPRHRYHRPFGWSHSLARQDGITGAAALLSHRYKREQPGDQLAFARNQPGRQRVHRLCPGDKLQRKPAQRRLELMPMGA